MYIFGSFSLVCEDVNDYLDVPFPLESNSVIELDVVQLECPAPQSSDELLAVVRVRGGALTLTSDSTVR